MIRRMFVKYWKTVLALVAVTVFSSVVQTVQAQSRYVITDGVQLWHIFTRHDDSREDVKTVPVHDFVGVDPLTNVEYDTVLLKQIGSNFLSLTIDGSGDATITNVTEFSPYCVWMRSGESTTGYYYQEHGNYRYYLKGGNTGLEVVKVEIGQPLVSMTYWYDWDFGAAMQEVTYRNGVKHDAYYWIIRDDQTWDMSCDSYERPAKIYYTCNTDTGICRNYYCAATPSAQNSPVTLTEHPAEIAEIASEVGLTAFTSDSSTLHYGNSSTLRATFNLSGTVNVREAYNEYTWETSRDGINTYWRLRTTDVFDSAGVPAYQTKYYDLDGNELNAVPEATAQTLEISDVTFTITDNTVRSYVTVAKVSNTEATLTYNAYNPQNFEVPVRITVTYTNGASETKDVTVQMSNDYGKIVKTTPENAPIVRGAVFGGGRMANVTLNTYVDIHNCDTISAVFGGNDISGQVLGSVGSHVRIGTDTTSTGVFIASVYGGGNGFYNYTGVTEGPSQGTTFSGSVYNWQAEEIDDNLVESGFTNAYIPDIQRTHVAIADELVVVDSVFGGAKNAFISATDGNSVEIKHSAGTVYAEFGGNNYGGSLGDGSTIDIEVSGTNTSNQQNITNTYFTGYGRTFGIRYLYGGGNKVEAPGVSMDITGGMIDTCFAGGNSASVSASPVVTINCADANSIFENSTVNGNSTDPDTWVGGKGRYNVRCLFGGNNQAAMEVLPTLTLTSGGLSTVYGGGNAGDMNYNGDIPSAITTTIATDTIGSNFWTTLSKLGTYVVVNSDDINIDYLYGGCQRANVKNSTYVKINAGNIGMAFGGCNISGDVGTESGGSTYIIMSGGTVYTNLFGGSDGEYHCNNGTRYVEGLQFAGNDDIPYDPYDIYIGTLIPTHDATHVYINGGTIFGNAYSGANLANVGFLTSTFTKSVSGVESTPTCPQREGETHLSMHNGTVKGNVFGGGNQASIYGLSYLRVDGGTITGSLFAGNDRMGSVEAFGGYIAADGTTDFNASDGTSLNNTDGSADYSAYVLLQGSPTIGRVYGGGNGAYNYGSNPEYGAVLELCDVDNVSKPVQSSSFIDINVGSGAQIDTVFGGGNGVGVSEGVLVLLNAEDVDSRYVNTIFGGNNKDNMEIVPDIKLVKGRVANVYGGCNSGNMTGGRTDITDACGNLLPKVTTYVHVTEDNVTVDSAIYGGCNMADVDGLAYIDIRASSAEGINYVYGGNNISGTVGSTRIDVSGGLVKHIYGGSNGYYDYTQVADGDYQVYAYGHLNENNYLIAEHTSGSPEVDSTNVNIYGGQISSSVYGGGRMGNCRATHVIINDQICGSNTATINGTVYGGGQGYYKDLTIAHRGNVTEASRVDLYHAGSVSEAKAYGGGQGGDVYNTYITTHESWDQPFDALYGGCWGSDVLGTAHVLMHGNTNISGYNVVNLFGGNDSTGNVYKSEVDVYSGKFQNLFGGGNGDYNDGNYTGLLQLPNTEYIELTLHDGNVSNMVYGGGKLGTTFRYQKDANGEDILDANGMRIPDTTAIHSDPLEYSYVMVNIHGGTVGGSVYAGGQGNDTPIIYGLKILNMDGGHVGESIYGGSENVDDGYMYECKGLTSEGKTSTFRPSSIINYTGGYLGVNVYGGGYLGNIYGSVYINVGLEAVNNSVVWTSDYYSADSPYMIFKPGYDGGYSPELTADSALMIESSIYGGANWGDNQGSANFNARGFYGGEGRILVDGEGYNTSNTGTSQLAQMNIGNSIIGSGTSALGGDSLCRIDVLNYGSEKDCSTSKTLNAIQRADELWLYNTAIEYLGASDVTTAYTSQAYTINRVDVINIRGYNILELDALLTNTHGINFYEDALDANGDPVLTTHQDLYYDDDNQCGHDVDMCVKLDAVDPDSRKYTAIIVKNGSNIDVMYNEADSILYGYVQGYGYLLAETGTNAIVTALSKYGTTNENHGGFMSTCKDTNQAITSTSGSTLVWGDGTAETAEYPYYNYSTTYRVWSVGSGKRTRYAVLLAHATPSLLDEDKTIKVTTDGGTTYKDLSIAHSQLILPPTEPGHYYKISASGITITDDNSAMKLVDSAWNPVRWNQVQNDEWQTAETSGKWMGLTAAEGYENSLTGIDEIIDDPNTSFGLIIASGQNFKVDSDSNYVAPSAVSVDESWNGSTCISGSKFVNSLTNFVTAQVGAASNASPIMDLYLTYYNEFSNTLVGQVSFTLEEYDSLGNNLGTPINVEVIISTIIENFRDMEYDVLAMYNEGRRNTFTRKAVLPATLQHRELYLQAVTWGPTDAAGEFLESDQNLFKLTGTEASITSSDATNLFGLTIQPIDNVSATVTSSVGWHSRSIKTPQSIFTLVKGDADATALSAGSLPEPDSLPLTNTTKGLLIGELDGRDLAALNFTLLFDGNKVYPARAGKGYVGKVVLDMATYIGGNDTARTFTITVNVKTRQQGDTIYIASANSVTRGGVTLNAFTGSMAEDNAGKIPQKYVKDFYSALSSAIYQEGDVVAVLDTVNITDGTQLIIQGNDYARIPVVRYEGHHWQMPGEAGVYRGPMIQVSGKGSSFAARCIEFNGSSLGKISSASAPSPISNTIYEQLYFNSVAVGQKSDTNLAYGPIIAVFDSAEVSIESHTTVSDNYNVYSGDNSRYKGAISVTDGGTLYFTNNVTVENNISANLGTSVPVHPSNGAIYVDGGIMQLNESHKEAATIITNNYLMPSTPVVYWTPFESNSNLIRLSFDTTNLETAAKANVFLTRTGDTMTDTQSEMIVFNHLIPADTRIGVSKWFPGVSERDTIAFAIQPGQNYLTRAVSNGNFVSDGGYNIFYNYGVDNQHIFLHRCATFKHQIADNESFLADGVTHPMDALEYRADNSLSCPTGGDTLIYRVQGGFFPYTYQWNGTTSGSRYTSVANSKINQELADGSYANYQAAIADTLLTSNASMSHSETVKHFIDTVSATDLAGCVLNKYIDVTLTKTDGVVSDAFVKTAPTANWTSADTGVVAAGTRYFKAIQITPYVWADRSAGTISAVVEGDNNDYIYHEIIDGEDTSHHELSSLMFCEGDVIRLYTQPKSESQQFIMWDFDPYYANPANYVVPAASTDVIAYYGPKDYWKDTVNAESVNNLSGVSVAHNDANYTFTDRANHSYVTTYNGDVHIYDEYGLAWFISVCNGLNGTQSRAFYFNKVFLHQKSDGTDYDMKNHLWTPVGTRQHRFRGWFIGTSSTVADTARLSSGSYVTVKNIIVNEPDADQAGFFGFIDTARVSGVKLQGSLIRGAQYVGTLAANSVNARIDNCAVEGSTEGAGNLTTILTTHYVSGGLLGLSSNDKITNSSASAKYMGDAVYSGGAIGYGTSSTVANSFVRNDSRMEGLYIGGVAGYLDGTAPYSRGLFRAKAPANYSHVENNYVHLTSGGRAERVGGLVGQASNTVIRNNYVYGDLSGTAVDGAVGAVVGTGTDATNNYYEQGSTKHTVGFSEGDVTIASVSDFEGEGNRVALSIPVYGVNNLTRVLNIWAKAANAEGGDYRTWRSDLDGVNNGYPVFGTPDLIPVFDSITIEGCDSIEWNGIVYTSDCTVVEANIIDSVLMIDSTAELHFVVHHGSTTSYTDTAVVGQSYDGYGFSVTATETALLRATVDSLGSATLVLSDTLQSGYGCDSIITLVLVFSKNEGISTATAAPIKVYPNPTTTLVHIEADEMQQVELYDNEGRRLRTVESLSGTTVTLDLAQLASGIYYIRVHRPEGVTIQKVIKR